MAYNHLIDINEDNAPYSPSNSSESESENSELLQSNHTFKLIPKQTNYKNKGAIKNQNENKLNNNNFNKVNNNNFNKLNEKRFPLKLIFGIIFSNEYKFQIISLINYNFRNEIINIDKLYEYLLPLLKESNQYKFYDKYGPELIKLSMLRLFQQLSKKQILNQSENQSNFSFTIGVKFDAYHQKLTNKLLNICIQNLEGDESDKENDVQNIYSDVESNITSIETEQKDIQASPMEMQYKEYNFKSKDSILHEIAEMDENILNHIQFLRLLRKDLTKDNELSGMIQKKNQLNFILNHESFVPIPFSQNINNNCYNINAYNMPIIPCNQNEIQLGKEMSDIEGFNDEGIVDESQEGK